MMKMKFQKWVAALISFMMIGIIFSMLPMTSLTASAICCRKDGFDKSRYTLTGNMAEDVATIAKSQKGRTGSQLGYTEAWCDEYVADCLENAGADSSIVGHGGTVADFESVMRKKGAVQVSSPKTGDLVFFTYSHVEIVTKVENGTVYCAGGNNGGTDNYKTNYCAGERELYATPRLYLRPNYSNWEKIDLTSPTPTISTLNSSSLKLTWTAAANATSYQIDRRKAHAGTAYETIATTNQTTYTDTGLETNTKYWYRVYAIAGSNKSSEKNSVSGTTYTLTSPTPTISTISSSSLKLTWTAAANATSYQIDRRKSGTDAYETIATTNQTTYTDTGLEANTKYWYRVYAVADYRSSEKNSVSGTTDNIIKMCYVKLYDDGQCLAAYSISCGTVFDDFSLPDMSKDGYTFDGWYTKESGGTRFSKGSKVPEVSNLTLYTHWTVKTNNECSVTWNDNYDGGSTCGTILFIGNEFGIYANSGPSRTGYTFDGWYTEASGGTRITSDTKVPNVSKLVLYAHWVAETDNRCSITWNDNYDGGSTMRTIIPIGTEFGSYANSVPSRTGYIFEGWYTETNGGTRITSDTEVPNVSSLVLYAHWTPKTYSISFYIDKDIICTWIGAYNSVYGTLPKPSNLGYAKEGYTFDGWYTEENGGTKITSDMRITGEQNLYAHWTKKKYTVYFNANGGNCSKLSAPIQYRAAYGYLPEAQRDGYRFLGWYTEKDGGTKITSNTTVTATSSHTLHAHWTANKYTVYFNANGGNCSKLFISVQYHATYSRLPEAQRDGYRFLGWYTLENEGVLVTNDTFFLLTKDQTLYAHWEKINLPGDLNGDNKIALTDLIPLQKYLLRQTTLTTDQSAQADLNGDDMINVIDLILLKRTLLTLS